MKTRLAAVVVLGGALALTACGPPTEISRGTYAVGYDSGYGGDVRIDPGTYRTDGGPTCGYTYGPTDPARVAVSSQFGKSATGTTQITVESTHDVASLEQGLVLQGPCKWKKVS